MTNAEFINLLTREQIFEIRRKFNDDFRKLICDSTPDEECDRQLTCFECKINWWNREYNGKILPNPTNFQVIKELNIDVLADFLDEFSRSSIPCKFITHEECKNFNDCTKCIAHWLAQEHKGEKK